MRKKSTQLIKVIISNYFEVSTKQTVNFTLTALLNVAQFRVISLQNTRFSFSFFSGLMKLITTEDDYDVNEKDTITKMASQIDLSRVVEVLTRQLSHKQIHTRIAVLRWVLQLHMKTPNRVIYIIISSENFRKFSYVFLCFQRADLDIKTAIRYK